VQNRIITSNQRDFKESNAETQYYVGMNVVAGR